MYQNTNYATYFHKAVIGSTLIITLTNGTYHATVSAAMVSVIIHSQKVENQTVLKKMFSKKCPPFENKKSTKDTPQTRRCYRKSHSSIFVNPPQ